MKKHEDCEERCQLNEHKGYPCCQGECEWLQDEEYKSWLRNMSSRERAAYVRAMDEGVD